ncbi:hypothetical protein MJ1HA_1056 [Metallosphaera sedula]|nr:hypothetical protein MJ1HA_1056 [Metallosphaera sedula]
MQKINYSLSNEAQYLLVRETRDENPRDDKVKPMPLEIPVKIGRDFVRDSRYHLEILLILTGENLGWSFTRIAPDFKQISYSSH